MHIIMDVLQIIHIKMNVIFGTDLHEIHNYCRE